MNIKKIGTLEVVIMILTACLGIRWIPVAGSIGLSAIFFWLLGAILFFIPLSLIIIELSSNYDGDGGVYLWVKDSLGEKFGFFTAWLYWVNNLFFYPGLLVFMIANFAYLIGNKLLAGNPLFVITCVIISLWVAIAINIMGVRFIARITGFACALNISLGLFIIGAGVYYLAVYHHTATYFSLSEFIPHKTITANLSNLTLLMFALSGLELIPTMAGSIRNSRRTLKRSIVISIVIIMIAYIAGSLAINVILSPAALNNTTGLMDALETISHKLNIFWLAGALIFFLLLVEFGALIVWLIAPTIMLFECATPGILPAWMQKLNSHGVPANALFVIGVVVTLIVIVTQYLPTVNSIFTVLVLMGTIVYFLPYLFLAVGYIKLRKANRLRHPLFSPQIAYTAAVFLFISVFLGICLSFSPTSDLKTTKDLIIYEAELILGPLLFVCLGYLMHRRIS
jgi:amino acid transporter